MMKTPYPSRLSILSVASVVAVAGSTASQSPRAPVGAPEFKNSAQLFGTGATIGVWLEDLDADGDRDAVVSNLGPSMVLMNDGKGTFVDAGRVGDRFNSQGCVHEDVDNDGDRDLFISDYRPGNTSIWLNQRAERAKTLRR